MASSDVHVLDRGLHDDRIGDAHHRIDPVVRGDRAAAAQRRQHIAGDILLRQAQFGGAGAVHVQVQFGHVGHLLNVNIHGARNLRDAGGDRFGEIVVRRVVADDADVDGSGQAEVQDLAHHVRRLEVEGDVGEFFVQRVPHLFHREERSACGDLPSG